VSSFSAGLHYYHQRHGLNSIRHRASECVELYLRFMYLQTFVFVIRARSICPQMHRSLEAYCATLNPPAVLDVPTFAARCLHVHTTQEILAAKGGTAGENVGR
jgi:hypothetical protein